MRLIGDLFANLNSSGDDKVNNMGCQQSWRFAKKRFQLEYRGSYYGPNVNKVSSACYGEEFGTSEPRLIFSSRHTELGIFGAQTGTLFLRGIITSILQLVRCQ